MGHFTWMLVLPAVLAAMLADRYHEAALSIAALCALVSISLLSVLLCQQSKSFGWHSGQRSSTQNAGSTMITISLRQEEAHPQNNQRWSEELVAMDALVRTIECKFCSVRMLGLAGMGGLGKTTLAKAIFSHWGTSFEYTCFVPNMKLIAGTEQVAEEIVWKHMHHHGKKVAEEQYWSSLKGKKILLVFDDVCLRDQKVLLDLTRDSSPDSRFITTSRDLDLLSNMEEVFLVPFLESEDAEVLFRKCAFPNQAEPPKDLEIVMKDIIKKCDRLPLTLEVIGKYLRRKRDYKEWEQTLDALTNAEEISSLNERLWAKLRRSYNDLTETEQQIFLDATTFYCNNKKWTLRMAKAAWSAAYDAIDLSPWQKLVDKSLVYFVGEDDTIKVHEQLQSLGQKIASEQSNLGKRRVWDAEVALKMLQTTGRLDGKYSGNSRPYAIWDSSLVLNGKACLNLLGELNSLDQLELQFCEKLHTLPEMLGQLMALDRLKLWRCEGLESLPTSSGELKSLNHLIFYHYFNLHTLPGSLWKVKALHLVELYWCWVFERLPQSLGAMINALNFLDLWNSPELHPLPEALGRLSTLTELELDTLLNPSASSESFNGR